MKQQNVRSSASLSFTSTYGAQLLDDGHTRFRLWAPDAHRVELELEDAPAQAMQRLDDGAFELTVDCPPGSRYRYRVITAENAEGMAIPDPAARTQDEDVNGPSLVVDPGSHVWQHTDWCGRPWQESVIYEVHVGLLGGFAGVRRYLPYLVELGVTAIELMPVAEFPGGRNWGYDGVLPYAVEADYGSPDELKALVDAAHGQGLMVFLDVVYNHFGPDGNYLASYAGGFFRQDLITPWGASIDFRAPQVRRYFIDNALMWLQEYRFDGLRFDAVHAISEQDFLVEMAEEIRAHTGPERHVHLVLENEGNSASLLGEGHYDAQWNDDWHNVMHVLLTGEGEGYYAGFTENPTQKLARCLSEGFIYQGENTPKGHARGEPSAHLPPSAFVIFLQNHDQIGNRALGERLSTLADPDALAAATLLLLLSPMVPLLFMGEEWGSEQPFLFFTSHKRELAEAVREGRRGEFADFPAFRDETARERIPDPNDPATYERSRPDFDSREDPPHAAWLERYRHWLKLRHQHLVPHLAGTRSLSTEVLGEKALLARWRLGNDDTLTILLNLRDDPLGLDEKPGAYCLAESRGGVAKTARQGWLAPRSASVWLREREDKESESMERESKERSL
ncbi:malto-oligosyltrehalose trehalohydrolase [Pistricoccus aurantiacus]|uniref:malto-oligosyltrehalose trehalohydrolase n=1 Tax=Pistricoccus aurantiacus TaxID=1883414 RepID=UPI00363825B5